MIAQPRHELLPFLRHLRSDDAPFRVRRAAPAPQWGDKERHEAAYRHDPELYALCCLADGVRPAQQTRGLFQLLAPSRPGPVDGRAADARPGHGTAAGRFATRRPPERLPGPAADPLQPQARSACRPARTCSTTPNWRNWPDDGGPPAWTAWSTLLAATSPELASACSPQATATAPTFDGTCCGSPTTPSGLSGSSFSCITAASVRRPPRPDERCRPRTRPLPARRRPRGRSRPPTAATSPPRWSTSTAAATPRCTPPWNVRPRGGRVAAPLRGQGGGGPGCLGLRTRLRRAGVLRPVTVGGIPPRAGTLLPPLAGRPGRRLGQPAPCRGRHRPGHGLAGRPGGRPRRGGSRLRRLREPPGGRPEPCRGQPARRRREYAGGLLPQQVQRQG